MNLRMNTKKGSFFLEAAITIPVFLLGILILASIITIACRCENINYILCDEVEILQQRALYLPTGTASKDSIESRVRETNLMENFSVERLSFKYSDLYGRDLIKIKAVGTLSPQNIFDWDSNVNFSETIMARGYTGTKERINPLGEDEFNKVENYEAVYVFPTGGIKYHKKNCTYVNSYPSRTVLTESVKRKYQGCRLCEGYKAAAGQMVYCFEYGGAYHFRNCPTINKYVIEIDKQDAIEKGYLPCLKCGG